MFEKQDLVQCAEVFKNSNSTPQEVITHGIRFLLSMYGAPKKTTCLDTFRYACLVKNTRNKKQVQLACLPPTSAAAHQHLLQHPLIVKDGLAPMLNHQHLRTRLIPTRRHAMYHYSANLHAHRMKKSKEKKKERGEEEEEERKEEEEQVEEEAEVFENYDSHE
ncbi:unnamed protein product [Psylliodes chrysocephalus]|uniref:Uncharacterized protein n=1 Tax=Psylliodes chrysocephalus TaxID=3402493 RepID=A0A9P0CWC7_9CUCU|nr:unnamed protein product [Psylliodes chrysocephala]